MVESDLEKKYADLQKKYEKLEQKYSYEHEVVGIHVRGIIRRFKEIKELIKLKNALSKLENEISFLEEWFKEE